MAEFKIDLRGREDIINQIKSMAPYYVPEWRFNPEDADPGTALALIWADMFTDTLQKYNQILEQNKVAFFNALGTNLKPAIGAEGFLTFKLQPEDTVGGYIEQGTEVFADTPEGSPVYFATRNGIYVSPFEILDIISVMPAHDKLIHSWNGSERESAVLFDKNGVDLQTHYIHIGHSNIFDVNNEGCIYISFQAPGSGKFPAGLFASEETGTWEYLSEEGYVPFTKVSPIDGGVTLQFDDGMPPILQTCLFQQKRELRFIRLTLMKPEKFDSMAFEQVHIYSQNYGLAPSLVYSNDLELKGYGFYPFGERFGIYQEVYIACDEALGKFGAEIELTFDMRFLEIEASEKQDKNVNWKPIMKKSDFDKEIENHMRLKKTVWEYFNGFGWATLPVASDRHEKLFYAEKGNDATVRCQVNFICPEDMSDILVNAYEKKYIRIRILEVENAFSLNGYYVTPWIENMGFRYHYPNKNNLPEALIINSNCEFNCYSERQLKSRKPILFFEKRYTTGAAYFRCDSPPVGSPIKILFCLANEYEIILPQLTWEYYSKVGWQKLSAYDETYNFAKSGLITFIGYSDFEPAALFGLDGYWIRCVDSKSEYDNQKQRAYPVIEKLHINTVRIDNLRLREEEIFNIEVKQASREYALLNGMVSGIKCYVLEIDGISKDWVLWEEVNSFVFSKPDSKHYMVDRSNGRVLFGDGVYGKIPEHVPGEGSIRIEYSTNDGARSNLEAGVIERFSQTKRLINRIFNPLPTVGGYNQEDTAAAMKRSADSLTHLFRAVTASDYEALACEASLNVRKCKCFTNTNAKEEYEEGCVTLIVLQKDYIFGNDYFIKLKKLIKDYIITRNALPLTAEKKFEVVPPRFIRMNVKVYCSTDSMDHVFYIQQMVIDRINAFLDPVSGNFSGAGWEIGNIPNVMQITNYIKSVAHIKSIEKIIITYATRLYGYYSEVDLDHIARYRFTLPENGKHEIFVSLYAGRS